MAEKEVGTTFPLITPRNALLDEQNITNDAQNLFAQMELFAKKIQTNSPFNAEQELIHIISQIRFYLNNLPANYQSAILAFIYKYEHLLTHAHRLEPFFHLNNPAILEEYIKHDYESLKKCFAECYVVNFDDSALDVLDYVDEIMLTENNYKFIDIRDIYTIPAGIYNYENNYLIYKYFFPHIHFFYKNNNDRQNPFSGILKNMPSRAIYQILKSEEDQGNYSHFAEIWPYIRANFHQGEDYTKVPLDNISFLQKAIALPTFTQHKKYDVAFMQYYFNKLYEKILNKANTDYSDIISENFIANLKYLKTLNKKDYQTSPYYLYALKVFKNYYCQQFNCSLSAEEEKIVELLFGRLIRFGNIYNYLLFANLEEMYFYFRTNEILIINNHDVTWEDIKKLNYTEYQCVCQLLNPLYQANDALIIKSELVKWLCILGYKDLFALLTLDGFNLTFAYISEFFTTIYKHLVKHDAIYKEKLWQMILDNKNIFLDLEYLAFALNIFDNLYAYYGTHFTSERFCASLNDIENILYPNIKHIKPYLELLNCIKKGNPLAEQIAGIILYNQYRFRRLSSIPDISLTYESLDASMVNMHDPKIISNGINDYLFPENKVNFSCLTPNGKAKKDIEHGALNPHGRFFSIKYQGQIIAYSWVWRAGDVLCFDNIEVTSLAKMLPNYQNIIVHIYEQAAQKLLELTKKEASGGIKAVLLGKNSIDIIATPLAHYPEVPKNMVALLHPNNTNLYLEDSQNTKYILAGNINDIQTLDDVKPVYRYNYHKVESLKNLSIQERINIINSFYFDYCLFVNQRYKPLKDIYIDGIYGEDWFIGFKDDKTIDFFYRTDLDCQSLEIIRQLISYVPAILKPNYECIPENNPAQNILNTPISKATYQKVREYISSIKTDSYVLKETDFFHSPQTLSDFAHILQDRAINSAVLGKRKGNGVHNGPHFISLSNIGSALYSHFIDRGGFVIDGNICAFPTNQKKLFNDTQLLQFVNSNYPLRPNGLDGEWQVLNAISLNSCKAILVNENNIKDIIYLAYLEDSYGIDLPLVSCQTKKVIDPHMIKSLTLALN